MVAVSSIRITVIFCRIYLLNGQVRCITAPWIFTQHLILTSFGKLWIVFISSKLFCMHSKCMHSKCIVSLLTLSHKLGSWMPTTHCPLNQSAYTFQIFFCTVCKGHNHYRATYLPLNLCHWLYTLIILNTVPLQVFTKKSKEDKICTLSCYNLWYAIFINAMFMLSLIWIFFHFLSSHKCKEERYTQTKFCIPVVQNIYISKIPFKCVWSVQDKKNTP